MRIDQLITGNDEVQQHVASERQKQGLVAVSPMARKAIRLEILPQIEESVFSVKAAEDMCADTKRAIEAAFSYKNPLYTRLISYKGIEQSDGQFLTDLKVVMDEWLRGIKARLEDEKDEQTEAEVVVQESGKAPSSKDQEVNVDVNVNVNGQEQEAKTETSGDAEEIVEFEDRGKPAPKNVLEKTEDETSLQLRDDDEGISLDLDPADVFGLQDVRM